MYQRIVSLAPSNTEIVYALGGEDKLVACTRYCDFPAEAKKKPRIGGWLDINDELVKSYKPDLILTSTFVQNKITGRYRKNKMNIVSVMPTTVNGVFDSIISIGGLVDKKREANEVINSMKNKIKEMNNKIENHNKQNAMNNNCSTNKNSADNKINFSERKMIINYKMNFNDKNALNKNSIISNKNQKNNTSKINKPRVYIEEWHKPPTVSGNWVPNLVKIAGGDYSLIKAGVHSREVTTKQIQKYNPEIIVISICGMSDKVPKEWITKRKGWENLSAVKNNKVFVFDDSLLNRPGPRLMIGLEKLARIIHPECF